MGILNRILRWLQGPRVVLETKRGTVTHRYVYKDRDDCHARCVTSPFSDEAKIDYYIPTYRHLSYAGPERIHFKLVEDTIHELTHWASDKSDYHGPEEGHSKQWSPVIYSCIDYVTDDVSIEVREK